MSAAIPLRPELMPQLDVEREMLSFVADQLREYIVTYGEPPASIAFALIGADHGDAVSEAYSWAPMDESKSRFLCCAAAAALFLKRAHG